MPRSKEPPYTVEQLKILTVKEWGALNGLSLWTAKQIIARGDGPPVVQLSKRRIGIRVGDAARWQEARIRKNKAA